MSGETLIELLAILIASAALICSFLSYRQSHKINNENILYQEKINAYKDIMYALSDLLNTIDLYFDLTDEKLDRKKLGEEHKKEALEFTEEIERKSNEFDSEVKANAAILPGKILSKLEDLAYNLFRLKPLVDLQKSDVENYDKSLEGFYEQAEKLVGMFRKDLNTKELNQGLFRRIKR